MFPFNTSRSGISAYFCFPRHCSHKRGEASDGGPRARGQAAGWPVEVALLAGSAGALLGGGGSPATFGPEQAALALRLARGLLRLGAGRAQLGRQRR